MLQDDRYDRQIRLWGHHGQSKCLNSKVCLIKANSLGTEILKGLCLAGLGSITILDSHKLVSEDFGSLLLPHSFIGKNRAESVKHMLLDLNDSVNVQIHPLEFHLPHVTDVDLVDFCVDNQERHLEFWRQFNCVIVCGFMYRDQISMLSRICWSNNVPLINCRSIGYIGSMDIQIMEHIVIETHPDNPQSDLCLDKPFDELKAYFDSINLDDGDQLEKIHRYPYIVIVYKYLREWQKTIGVDSTTMPKTYDDKTCIKKLIEEALKNFRKRRKTTADIHNSQSEVYAYENFIEAVKAINTCLATSSELPRSVKNLFDHPRMNSANTMNVGSRFWQIMRALREYVLSKNDGQLPISGSLPDMTSTSEEYIKLQNICMAKAKDDLDSVFKILLGSIDGSNFSQAILYDETKLICKNVRDIHVITTGLIDRNYDIKTCDMREDHEYNEYITIGVCLKAVDVFLNTYSRLPGGQEDQVETDITKLKDCLKQIIGRSSNSLKTLDQWLYEICRYGGAELLATSAFLGGCVAQEVIKIVTNQYVPVQTSLIYNSKTSSVQTFSYEDYFSMET